MRKTKGIPFEKILEKQLNKGEIRFAFEERRFYLQIARLVGDLRAKAGISQTALAKAAGVSQPLIARLETGDQRRTPTFDMVFKILKALGYRLEVSVHKDEKKAG